MNSVKGEKSKNCKMSTEASEGVQTQTLPKGTDVTIPKEQNEHFLCLWE